MLRYNPCVSHSGSRLKRHLLSHSNGQNQSHDQTRIKIIKYKGSDIYSAWKRTICLFCTPNFAVIGPEIFLWKYSEDIELSELKQKKNKNKHIVFF